MKIRRSPEKCSFSIIFPKIRYRVTHGPQRGGLFMDGRFIEWIKGKSKLGILYPMRLGLAPIKTDALTQAN
jgi:hypothetical protein